MNIIISGYGRMGKQVEQVAIGRGHHILACIEDAQGWEQLTFSPEDQPVVIDFSLPEVAVEVYTWCFQNGLPVVSGTTGWLARWEEVVAHCRQNNGTFLYASNFSLGVNIFFEINRKLASIMGKIDGYRPSITEIHHVHKLDAPSGTAITLANQLIEQMPSLKKWTLDSDFTNGQLPISSLRQGEVPGTHVVSYESEEDVIAIEHRAKNRRGFALGAVLAAEFVRGKSGVYTMKDVLTDLL